MDRWLNDLRTYRRVALDTNVVIYALEEVAPYKELVEPLFNLMERGFIVATVSTIVEAEVLVKPIRERDRLTLRKVELFFRNSPNLVIRGCDRAVARRAASVRARTPLRLPDAIVVATAVEEGCDALIGNDAVMGHNSLGTPYMRLDDYIL